MIIIEYNRYVTDTKTWIGLVGLKIEQMHYHIEKDHNNSYSEQQTDYNRALITGRNWLRNHFGHVKISIDTETGITNIKLSNKKKFIREFLYQGVQLIEDII